LLVAETCKQTFPHQHGVTPVRISLRIIKQGAHRTSAGLTSPPSGTLMQRSDFLKSCLALASVLALPVAHAATATEQLSAAQFTVIAPFPAGGLWTSWRAFWRPA
jgi:hypothetical protein